MPDLQAFRKENKLKSWLGIAALLIVPTFLALLALAKFSESNAPVALEHAQLARHIAAGEGLTTGVLRPVALTLNPTALPAADLVNAPVHPLLLAGIFAVTGASTRVAAVAGLGVWLLTAWLVFGIARRWWNGATAGLATMFFVGSLAGLLAATAGLPHPLLALLVLGAVAAVFSKTNKSNPEDSGLALWQPVLAGLLCGAVTLTDYRMAPLALVLGVFLFVTQKRRAAMLSLFIGGWLLVLAPWGIRNLMVSGRVFGLYWYGALENTREFPGESIWRLTNVPKHPLLYLVMHPLDLGRKLIFGLAQYRQAGMGILEPITVLLGIVALFGAPAQSSRRRLAGIVVSGVILSALFSCLTRPEAQLTIAWAPLLACLAGAQLAAWVPANVTGFNRPRLGTRATQSLTYAGVILLVAFPVLMHFTRVFTNQRPDLSTTINNRLTAGGAVLTDVPAYAAWYWNRPALLLCQREADLAELEKQSGKIAGVYLSPAINQLPQTEVGDWWIWLASARGVYHGLALASNHQLPGLLRVPQAGKTQAIEDLELDRLVESQKTLHADPQAADSQMQLAFTYLKFKRLHEAQQIFKEVVRLDHDNIDAQLGLWQALAQLRHSDGTLRLAQLTTQVAPNDPRAKPVLEQAAEHFEQARAQYPRDPWLLLNLLGCRARLGQWKEVEACYAQLTQIVPKIFPARLVLARLYVQQEEIAKAATECAQLVQEHPSLPAAHELAGLVWLAQNKPEEALKESETAVRLRPQWVDAQVQAGQICWRLKRYADGVKYLQAALKLAPNAIAIKLSLADLYEVQANDAGAIELYREVLTANAKQTVALNNLASLLVKTGKAAEALPLARQAVSIEPQNPNYRDTAGWTAFLAGNKNEALLHLLEAVRLAPQFGLTHFHLGKILLSQGQKAEARQEFKRAVDSGLPAAEKQEAQTALAAE
ncbi:MAG: tetratricopeptide repeat protein [Verrucomicrobiota bacterium]|jgi:tetratricopeptide (TPR) repeat protein